MTLAEIDYYTDPQNTYKIKTREITEALEYLLEIGICYSHFFGWGLNAQAITDPELLGYVLLHNLVPDVQVKAPAQTTS